jgi:hypothetical protein
MNSSRSAKTINLFERTALTAASRGRSTLSNCGGARAQDDRPAIIEHWKTAGTWLRSPILIAGEVLGTSLDDECLVGFSRLGNLLGLLDRQEIPETTRYRVWLGRCQAVGKPA